MFLSGIEYIPRFISFATFKNLSFPEKRGIIPRFSDIQCSRTFETRYKSSQKGFTLVEIIISLAIIGVVIGMFYTMWAINYSSFDEHMIRADLWQEANRIVEAVSLDARQSKQIELTDNKTVVFKDRNNTTFVTYKMQADGSFQMLRVPDLTFKKLAAFIDFNNSFFEKVGKGLKLNLQLSQKAVGRKVNILASTEIYPRN